MFRPSAGVLLFIFITIAFTVVGQLLVKRGMLEVGASPTEPALLSRFVLSALFNLNVLVGMACALVAALSWTVAISRSNLSFAYPFTGLSVVLVLALSGVVFGEAVPINRWIGVALVCIALIVASARG